ncbi:hypothetical protein [Deinococcus multiflagellatus]|uniref:hypothetical protein n=1 Tax=Deinococcus multiflagellatus TaxID=1656887 RepID=UPI001CC9F3A9|nr:hypothetical protein [Deinococcus multiflagellatus]MBZ9715482.1 hypothetical protein [Deinococcus multiflagellatus]
MSPLMGEALRRGQAPWLRPAKVEQFRDGVWRPSASALKALDKRIAYPPTRWPEELDDRTSASGRLRLTFTDSFPGGGEGVLVLRVRVRRDVPVCAVHGPVTLLGHNVGQPLARGWHPALLPVGPLNTPFVTELRLDVPVSRALLGRGGFSLPGGFP